MFICQDKGLGNTHTSSMMMHGRVANRRCLVLDYVSANLQTADVTPEETQEKAFLGVEQQGTAPRLTSSR